MIMSGIIRFVDFEDIKEARPLTLQKYGTVQFNQDFSKEPVTVNYLHLNRSVGLYLTVQ